MCEDDRRTKRERTTVFKKSEASNVLHITFNASCTTVDYFVYIKFVTAISSILAANGA